jgi:hypothetical protein
MQTNLYQTLIERNLINEDIVVTATVKVNGFHTGIFESSKEMMWDPRMSAEHVHAIEGMEPERYAKSYNIKPDGSVKKYKKRGRKPKAELA